MRDGDAVSARERAVDGSRLEGPASLSLCEALDRVLHKGVAVHGDVVLSVADVDLVYLGLRLILCSTDTARRVGLSVPAPLLPRAGSGGGAG
jgi:hypothetical protein